MIFKNLIKTQASKFKSPHLIVKRHQRSFPFMDGRSFQVHSGKQWVTITVVPLRLGLKFGNFVLTRKKAAHKIKRR